MTGSCAAKSSAVVGLGVGHASREQAVGDGLGVHIGEAAGVEVVDQRLAERLHQAGDRPVLRLDGEDRADPVANGSRELRQLLRERLRRRDDLAVAELERRAPPLAPRLVVPLLLGAWPREPLDQGVRRVLEVERRVQVVPREHLERRQVVPLRVA